MDELERQSSREAGFEDAACLGGRAHHSKPKLGEHKCQCTACGELFSGTQPFDKHRIGEYGKDRRCMTPAEIIAAGFQRNANGFWSSETREQRALRHRATGAQEHRAPLGRVNQHPEQGPHRSRLRGATEK